MSGQINYLAGLAAEQSVAARYVLAGHRLVGHRWRGAGGEIDLIFEAAGDYVFVEVKKSATHARAAASLGKRQIARLFDAATAFLAGRPDGAQANARFDVALVDGIGAIDVLEGALCA